MSDDNFQPGEMLTWSNRPVPGGLLTKRQVAFRGWQNNQAVVAFGLKSDFTGQENLFSVPKEELSRPQPAGIKPGFYHPEKPEPAPSIPLTQRRQSLSQAFNNYQGSQAKVVEAQELLDRALTRVDKAQATLREYADMEAHHIDAVVHAIRVNSGNGVADNEEEWASKARAERDCQAAEAAYHHLARELSDAKAAANERHSVLEKCASFVLAGIIERETTKLAEWELEVATVRARLRAAQMIWFAGQPIPINSDASKILIEQPAEVVEGVGERLSNNEVRQQEFSELLGKLVAGEVDSDLSWWDDDNSVSDVHLPNIPGD